MKTNLKKNLFGVPTQTLRKWLVSMGEAAYRANQIQAWIFERKIFDFDDMSNLSKDLRQKLIARFEIRRLDTFKKHVSVDGSIKYIFSLEKGGEIEAVFMPMEKGITLCLSSQVGCAQDCSFCLTAQMGFIRNLDPAEIVGQAFAIVLDQKMESPFNIVMMGMGEPLLNLHNLEQSLDLFIGEPGFGLSPKRITVSTSGHVRNLLRLGAYPRLPRIAVSLNATTDEQRGKLMPVNHKWNIDELIEACRKLPIAPREKITIEYVLIKGINDSADDARRLVRLLNELRCKVNLIPFNETPGLPYRQPNLNAIEAFRSILNRSKILNMVRWSKGRDVGAACGQLATPVIKKGAVVPKSVRV